MNDEFEEIPLEDQGDGLPNMRWRLRAILASLIGGTAAWAAIISFIR